MDYPLEYGEKIGEFLVRIEEIRPQQVENILLRQQCGDRRRFGEIAVDLRYIEKQKLEEFVVSADLPLWKKHKSTHQGYTHKRDKLGI